MPKRIQVKDLLQEQSSYQKSRMKSMSGTLAFSLWPQPCHWCTSCSPLSSQRTVNLTTALEERRLERKDAAQSRRVGSVWARILYWGSSGEPLRVFEKEMTWLATAEPLGNSWLINLDRKAIFSLEVVTLSTCWEANVPVSLSLR